MHDTEQELLANNVCVSARVDPGFAKGGAPCRAQSTSL